MIDLDSWPARLRPDEVARANALKGPTEAIKAARMPRSHASKRTQRAGSRSSSDSGSAAELLEQRK